VNHSDSGDSASHGHPAASGGQPAADTAQDDTAQDDTAQDDTAPDDTAPDDTAQDAGSTTKAGPHSVNLLIDQIGEATGRLLATAADLTDQQVREDSLLPGWSRAHVLTHIARNADGLRNLLIWAKTGEETPQYPSREARESQIEAGSDRSAAELAADLAGSAESFVTQARELPEAAWEAEVRGSRGPSHPAWYTLHRRLFEIEIHHADLGAGYQPADWPESLVTEELYRITGDLASNPGTPAALLTDAKTGRQYFLRPIAGSAHDDAGHADDPPQASSELAITGPGYLLLAWLLGRDTGADLQADPAGPLPEIPSYG
jgi:maleylpyruvate isomerase